MPFQWSGLDQCLTGVGLGENGSRGNIDSSFKEFCCRGEQKSGAISGGVEELRNNSLRSNHSMFVC